MTTIALPSDIALLREIAPRPAGIRSNGSIIYGAVEDLLDGGGSTFHSAGPDPDPRICIWTHRKDFADILTRLAIENYLRHESILVGDPAQPIDAFWVTLKIKEHDAPDHIKFLDLAPYETRKLRVDFPGRAIEKLAMISSGPCILSLQQGLSPAIALRMFSENVGGDEQYPFLAIPPILGPLTFIIENMNKENEAHIDVGFEAHYPSFETTTIRGDLA